MTVGNRWEIPKVSEPYASVIELTAREAKYKSA